jgi:pyridoxine/pyridoxamine 5'-phosphate oxidase
VTALVEEFLVTARRAVLFCRDEDGAPIGYPMSVVAVRDGTLFFTTYTKSAKVIHLGRDPRAACILLAVDPPTRWVSSEGSVSMYHPTESEMQALFEGRPQDPRVPPGVTDSVKARLLNHKRIVIAYTPADPGALVIETGRGDDG